MRMHGFWNAGFVLAAGIALSASTAGVAETSESVPVATTPHFAFYSDFAVNLNDALIAAGQARRRVEPELFKSGPEKACFYGLPVAERAAWDRAVDYYAEIISPTDRHQFLLRLDFARVEELEELEDAGAQRFVEIARSFRGAAAPVYEECRWSAQDAKNRRWIEEREVQLAAHEQTIAPRLEELYRKPWDGLPIRVDVVETVNWSGANTILLDPDGGNIAISSNSNQGLAALETIFHEASHLLMRRGDPLQSALDEAAEAIDQPTPEDLWHVVLFYTTGETVRRVLDEADEPGYTPHLYEIFERGGGWARYRGAIESIWPAYLDGERALSEAATDLVQAIVGDTDQ